MKVMEGGGSEQDGYRIVSQELVGEGLRGSAEFDGQCLVINVLKKTKRTKLDKYDTTQTGDKMREAKTS